MSRRRLLLGCRLLCSGRLGCRLGCSRGLRRRRGDDHGLDAKLELGLCGTVELLVDSRVIAVKADVGCGAVGITFKDDVDIRRDGKQLAELSGQLNISIYSRNNSRSTNREEGVIWRSPPCASGCTVCQ